MDTFLQLLRESVLIQGLITALVLTSDVIIILQGKTVPDFLLQLTMLVVGFYFGAKTEQRAVAISEKMKEQ